MAETHPPERLGDLRLVRLLGEGGMGSVWLAYDEVLGRRVALKWVRHASPALVERLEQEAHLHARVEHPSVCRLYQVGEYEGVPYLVLQFVDGRTLDLAAPDLALPELLGLFVALADGVHAAHCQGLIHRDLKPSNLMVARDEDGTLRSYVMDFGLARDASQDGLTEAGLLLGTPAYMAPEQVTGAWLDPRTDVYGLGATLFAVLTGRPPFIGDREHVLAQLGQQEAPGLRGLRKDLSRDLETVVATCLAIDPARRYPSAAALRDDLQRMLDGLPIQARRMAAAERLLRWTSRNRLSASLAAGILALGLGLGATWLVLRQRAQAQSEWAQRFGQEVLRMDSALRFGRMLGPHDLARELGLVRRRMDGIHAAMAASALSRGPGHFALGEGHLLLGELEPAKRELELAWALGFRSAEVSLAYGRCLIQRYEDALASTGGILDENLREAKRAEHRKGLLEPALGHLARARRELGTLALEDEARLALAQNGFDEAERLARAASAAEPWRYDALYLIAKARALRGRERLNHGQKEGGRADLEAALGLAEELQRIGPSDDRLQDVAKFVWLVGAPGGLRGLDSLACMTRAVAAGERMLALNSTRKDMLHTVALNLVQLGLRVAAAGRDPEPWFQRAEELMRPVAAAPPGTHPPLVRGRALERLANLAYERATRAAKGGQDPELHIQDGLVWCRQALAEGLGQWETHQNLAFLEMVRADWLKDHGGDAVPAFERAVSALQDCARLNPSAASHANLAEVSLMLARVQATQGCDPTGTLEIVRESLAAAFRVSPGDPNALSIEGDRARFEAKRRRK